MPDLLQKVAKDAQSRYYGKFRGFVTDNQDPEKRGRLRLTVPSVLGALETGWALPCLPFGGLPGHGLFLIPEVGAQVWVEFEEGDVSFPIWTGTFWQKSGDPPAEATGTAEPVTRLLKTPSGHLLLFGDETDKEKLQVLHPKGAEIAIDEKGTMSLTDAAGARVVLDADAGKVTVEDSHGNTVTLSDAGVTVEDLNGNKVEMAAAGITVTGTKVVVSGQQVMLAGEGGEPILKGQSFLTLFATHVHPTAMGPSGPPIPQGEASALSLKVTTT